MCSLWKSSTSMIRLPSTFGTGKGHSVMEVILEVEKVTGCKVPYQISPRRPGDPPVLVAATERANQLLGWKSFHSLSGMISSAWAWSCHAAAGQNHGKEISVQDSK